MRFKKRYLVCELVYADGDRCLRKLSRYDVTNCLKEAIEQAHGDYGMGVLQKALAIKHLNVRTNIVIVRADRAFYKLLMSAMAFVKMIGKYQACFHTLHVGGTIRSCHKFLVKYHRQQLPLLLSQCTTDEERNRIREIIRSTDQRESLGIPPRRVDVQAEIAAHDTDEGT